MITMIKWILIFAVYAAMVGLSVYWFDAGGMIGLAGCGLGFALGFLAPGQNDFAERIGNGYVGSLAGLCIGFAAGGLAHFLIPYLQNL
jgi:hypothetical protein